MTGDLMSTGETTGKSSLGSTGRSLRILLVDDVELFLELEKTFFRREDVDLLVARSGEEALSLVAKEALDLVFLDLYMPAINGDEVCRRIKQGGDEGVPVIMVIQSGSPEDEQRCRDAGCDEILYKPVRREDFITAAGRNLPIMERTYRRVDASIIISFGLQPKKFLESFSVNISAGGIFVATEAILTVGTELHFKFQLPVNEGHLSCLGRVAWVNHPDWIKKPKLPVGMGIEFIDISPDLRRQLDLFVEHQNADTPFF